MSASYDVVIVGAGIVGAACAWRCANAGLKVVVLERGRIGGGATGAGMGHLVVMDDSDAQFELTAHSRGLWDEWEDRLPTDVEFLRCGTLWVAADEQEMQEVWRKHAYYSKRGVDVEVLDAQGVSEAEPNLRPGLTGALRVSGDAVIYPPTAARFFLEQAIRLGAQLRTGVEVIALQPEGGAVLANGSRLSAGVCINATGSVAPALSPGIPVRPRKGHLLITDRHAGFVNHQVVELGYLKSAHSIEGHSVAFNIQPRKTGQMLIGSSRQYDCDDSRVEPGILGRMLRRCGEYLPSLGELTALRAWTGHRAATPDKLPLVGPSAEHSRIWLATGHEGLGITTSLGTAALVVDLLLGNTPKIRAEPYSPTRFLAREPAHV